MSDPRVELERVALRWQQLPVGHALAHVERVRALAQSLANAVRAEQGLPSVDLPDLGPAVAMDQLRVMAYDATQAGLTDRLELGDRLAELRRALP